MMQPARGDEESTLDKPLATNMAAGGHGNSDEVKTLSLGYFSLGLQREVTRARSARNASKVIAQRSLVRRTHHLSDGRETSRSHEQSATGHQTPRNEQIDRKTTQEKHRALRPSYR